MNEGFKCASRRIYQRNTAIFHQWWRFFPSRKRDADQINGGWQNWDCWLMHASLGEADSWRASGRAAANVGRSNHFIFANPPPPAPSTENRRDALLFTDCTFVNTSQICHILYVVISGSTNRFSVAFERISHFRCIMGFPSVVNKWKEILSFHVVRVGGKQKEGLYFLLTCVLPGFDLSERLSCEGHTINFPERLEAVAWFG